MKQTNSLSSKDENMSSENGAAGLTQDQLLFTENIYASLPMSIEVYDANGVLRKINDKALKMYGVSDRTTVIGKVNLFNSPYMDEELKSKIQRGEDVTLEFEYDFDRINSDAYFCSQNKNSIIYEAQVVPVLADKGTIIGHILLSNDVTSAKEIEFRTEESKKNLEMAMEAANMASWVYNVHKKTFSTLHGNALAKEEMSLEQMQSILHPQDRIQLMQLFAQLINKETQQVHTTLRFYNKEERQYRHYESRMRLSSEHRGKLLIVGTQLDVTDKVQMLKKTQDLTTKRELAMQVSNIVHWDFDVSTQKFESYNDPINDYAPNRLVTLKEFESVVHPDDRSTYFDAIQSMLSGENETVNFTCRMQTKYDETWQYCNVIGVPFEQDENGNTIRFTGFRQNISKLHRLNEELKERNYKMELTFKTVGMSYWDFDVTGRKFTAFNDPVNDYHPETPIDVDQYLSAAHPDDRELVRKYFEGMIEGKEQEFNFQYRSKTKWNKEWQTLIITGIQVERDKRGKIIRYTGIGFNNTKWEKMAQELKILKDKAELSDRLKSAFTGNRFEFRAVGSEANCASAMIALNSAVADQLAKFKKDVDALIEKGEPKVSAILEIIRGYIKECKAIHFDGNGYSDEWKEEAARRGLDCETSVPVIFDNYLKPETIAMFEATGVMTKKELEARNEVKWETYTKKIQIEARVLGDLAMNHIIPVATQYQTDLINNVYKMQSLFPAEKAAKLSAKNLELIEEIADRTAFIKEHVDAMVEARKVANKIESEREKAIAYHDTIVPALEEIRYHIDKLELIVDNQMWTLPKYRELLFVR